MVSAYFFGFTFFWAVATVAISSRATKHVDILTINNN
jgi:hypothetical protein